MSDKVTHGQPFSILKVSKFIYLSFNDDTLNWSKIDDTGFTLLNYFK